MEKRVALNLPILLSDSVWARGPRPYKIAASYLSEGSSFYISVAPLGLCLKVLAPVAQTVSLHVRITI